MKTYLTLLIMLISLTAHSQSTFETIRNSRVIKDQIVLVVKSDNQLEMQLENSILTKTFEKENYIKVKDSEFRMYVQFVNPMEYSFQIDIQNKADEVYESYNHFLNSAIGNLQSYNWLGEEPPLSDNFQAIGDTRFDGDFLAQQNLALVTEKLKKGKYFITYEMYELYRDVEFYQDNCFFCKDENKTLMDNMMSFSIQNEQHEIEQQLNTLFLRLKKIDHVSEIADTIKKNQKVIDKILENLPRSEKALDQINSNLKSKVGDTLMHHVFDYKIQQVKFKLTSFEDHVKKAIDAYRETESVFKKIDHVRNDKFKCFFAGFGKKPQRRQAS